MHVMDDALRWIFGGQTNPFHGKSTEPNHELIDFRDRVSIAVAAIRDHELAMWFDSDWHIARQISRLCPACAVYSVPPDAMLVDDLRQPPRWRRRSQA